MRRVGISQKKGNILHRLRRVEKEPRRLLQDRSMDQIARRTAAHALARHIQSIGRRRKARRESLYGMRLGLRAFAKSDGPDRGLNEVAILSKQLDGTDRAQAPVARRFNQRHEFEQQHAEHITQYIASIGMPRRELVAFIDGLKRLR